MRSSFYVMDCPHFGTCGGCAVEGQPPAPPPYEEQLRRKETAVRDLLKDFAVAEWRPIVPSPDIWRYRNKMEFAFGAPFEEGPFPFLLGMRQAGRYDRIVDLSQCDL